MITQAHGDVAPETRAAWGAWSLRLTLAGTVFLLVSGLVILLGPFSRGAQVLVLAHTGGGLVLLVPLAVYLARHLRARLSDRFSHLWLLGIASGTAVVGASVTGVVLAWQAAFGTRISYGWDLAHVVLGVAAAPILGAHLATAVRRHRRGESAYATRRIAGACAVGTAVVVLAFAAGERVPAGARRASLPEGYSYRYGSNPFLPSLARTDRQHRVEQGRRWVKFLAEAAAQPDGALPQRVSPFLDAALRAHAADLDATARGETHADELSGLSVDSARIESLRGVAAAATPEERATRLAALAEDAKARLETDEAAFRAEPGIAPDALAGSASCGSAGCHEEVLHEWEPSAHRYASRSAFFQLIQKAMAGANGAESTRYCAGCHDPIALFSGAKHVYDDDLSSPGADEGVSCASCHSIVRTDVEGNGNFTMSPPVRYLEEDSFVGRFLIRAYPRHHVASYRRPLLGTPELCAACHKQFIDEELNRATRVQLQNQYDAWKTSHWFVPDAANPQRPDASKSLTCQDCHMRLMPSEDPAAGKRGGRHRHHGMVAANQWLPTYHDLPGAEKHVALTEAWLKGDTVIPEIADRWPAGPPVPLSIAAPESVAPGGTVRMRVTIENPKVGHTFPTGPLDVIQCWVDVRVTQGGTEVFRSGALDERGFIQEGAFQLKAEGVDRAGNLIDKHNLWDMVGARFRRAVAPGYSDTEEYTFTGACEAPPATRTGDVDFPAPKAGGEDLLVTAVLRYRKVNQTLLNMLDPSGNLRAPVTDMSTATARVRVEPAR